MWPHVGQARSRKSKYSPARALTSSATSDLRCFVRSRDVGWDATRRPRLRLGSDPDDTSRMSDQAAHPLVEQLRFTRSEFQRGLRGTSADDGVRRLEPMNSIGWIVAHMSWQEQRYFLT